MAATSDPASEPARLAASARALEKDGRPAEALAEAWRACDLDEEGSKRLVVGLLSRHPSHAAPERRSELEALAADPKVDPTLVAGAGWHLLLAPGEPLGDFADDPVELAARLEKDGLALRLLGETYVFPLQAEMILTRLRRHLLLSGRWRDFPRLTAALAAQAVHNEGAWLFEPDEKERLDSVRGTPIAAAFDPPRPAAAEETAFADPVTSAVANQYRLWPYPAWTRVMALDPTTLPETVEEYDGGRPSGLPVSADILVAGCGTGREAALTALSLPDSRIVAIDISPSSLAYAAERCAALGIGNVDFRLLDLHRVPELGRSFDAIFCSGVLHHLPDPEAGWAALADILRPGGVMRVMVYSRLSRLRVEAARTHIADLMGRPIDADLLREARRRLIEKAPGLLSTSRDFYTLGGVHDLLLHRHEDPFDIPRVGRLLDRLGLELLAFDFPTPAVRASYLRGHPHDPQLRDLEAMAALEMRQPFVFQGLYRIWCRKPKSLASA